MIREKKRLVEKYEYILKYNNKINKTIITIKI